MGSKNSKKLQQIIPQRNPDWNYTHGIKVEEGNIEQYKDHGTTNAAIGKIPVTSLRVKILPAQSFFFIGLMEKSAADQTKITESGVKGLNGVYGLGLGENEVVMNGVPTRYKRQALNSGDIISFKYEKDRIFFKIVNDWDLLYVVGEGKQFVFCCEMCHLNSRCVILEQEMAPCE